MRIAFVHGSNDLYGASNVLLHDVRALIEMGNDVAVQLPYPGPLDSRLRDAGCEVECRPFPVLRRSNPLDAMRAKPFSNDAPLVAADLAVVHTLAVVPAVVPLLGRR